MHTICKKHFKCFSNLDIYLFYVYLDNMHSAHEDLMGPVFYTGSGLVFLSQNIAKKRTC